ncbi:hypothetical protein B0H10DRAFT_1976394 [Mycena sp. CBHHK59/15]|nr:hypothetical protein B0H10DRAFT_1976394 [Mycena sp. CBHHK59/15]
MLAGSVACSGRPAPPPSFTHQYTPACVPAPPVAGFDLPCAGGVACIGPCDFFVLYTTCCDVY